MDKMRWLTVVIIFFICLSPALAQAQDSTTGSPSPYSRLLVRGEVIAGEISRLTGCAISPILGISVLGAYTYYTTPAGERDSVPWHAAPKFWAPLLVILFGIILKDSSKIVIPKLILVPLDAMETLLEKNTSAVLALTVLLTSISGRVVGELHLSGHPGGVLFPSAAHAAAATGPQALAPVSGMFEPAVISVLIIAVFIVVWVVSQAFNFLILLSPFSSIDLLLTLWKNCIVALLLGAYLVHPYAGLLFSLCVILLCAFLFSRSFRFVVFGSLMGLDMLRRKKNGLEPDSGTIKVFAGADLKDVPSMSYGTLGNVGQVLRFTYRPWLILPLRVRQVQAPPCSYYVGKGTLSPIIVREGSKPGQYATLCRLRPLYASRENMVANALGLAGVRDLAFGRSVRDGLNRLKENLHRRKTTDTPAG